MALETDPRFEPFEAGWSSNWEAVAHMVVGRVDRFVEICTALVARTGFAHMAGLCSLTWLLPALGRDAEAMAMADEALAAARSHGNPFFIACALDAYGRAFTETDPLRALDTLRAALTYAREHRVVYWEAIITQDVAGLEAVHGDLEQGLELFDTAIDLLHQAGNVATLTATLNNLAVFFDRFERPEIAATLYGTTTNHAATPFVIDLARVVEHLRTVLGKSRFDECVTAGAAMELGEAVQYARGQIRLTQSELGRST